MRNPACLDDCALLGYLRIGELAFRQGDAGHGEILKAFLHRYGKTAPAASDIENAMYWPLVQLGGKSRQLGSLSRLETVFRTLEIGAGMLATRVKKRFEQLVR